MSPDSILLDTMRPTREGGGGAMLFEQPLEIIEADAYDAVEAAIERVQAAARMGLWCAGYIAYEAAYAFDQRGFPSPPALNHPLVWFAVYERPQHLSDVGVDELLADEPMSHVDSAVLDVTRSEYQSVISTIRRHIREGDVYQINYTAPLRFAVSGSSLGLYRDLRRKQRVAYGAVIRRADSWILSLSPELLVRMDGDRLTARPMKGTAPRAPGAEADQERGQWLRADEKNRAENLMIVDLIRNDLSRVAEAGSVKVPSLFEVERYETLWQMTSTVEARAKPGVGFTDVVRALFPCGSVTGAPKRRAMQIIRELETVPRGPYCGAIGYVRPGGDFSLSVPIRTLVVRGSEGTMGIGSGVVWDSRADDEFEECLLKARFLTNPPRREFELLETMRASNGRIELVDRHRARLSESASYFGFSFDPADFDTAVGELGEGDKRVRVLLARDGRIRVESTPLAEDLITRTAIIYPRPINKLDPIHHHKTTERAFYSEALAWAQTRGADEAILLNMSGEVAEGTFTNVWIETGGRLITPPAESGGIPGVYRAHILDTNPDATTRVLRPEDLARADRILLSNAMRGLQEVVLVDSA